MMQHGDLIFSQIGSDANAISAVTRGLNGARLNHMGMLLQNRYGLYVLEAFPPEVRVTQVDVFIRRTIEPITDRERYMVCRLQPAYAHLIEPALQYGLAQRNRPYDELYLTDPRALYCSELIVDMFRAANGGDDFFVERPMRFVNPESGLIHPAWIEYYAKFGIRVPQGEPGSNPADISTDPRLELITVQGPPSGYTQH